MDNEYCNIALLDGIIIRGWKTSFVNLDTAKMVVNSRQSVTASIKYPALVKMESLTEFTKEASVFLSSK